MVYYYATGVHLEKGRRRNIYNTILLYSKFAITTKRKEWTNKKTDRRR